MNLGELKCKWAKDEYLQKKITNVPFSIQFITAYFV